MLNLCNLFYINWFFDLSEKQTYWILVAALLWAEIQTVITCSDSRWRNLHHHLPLQYKINKQKHYTGIKHNEQSIVS